MDKIISLFQSGLTGAFSFVVLLGVLVFVHELGHFLVARWCGVRVEVFSLGFGKKLFQYKRGETNYCLSLIPLGGYVKMFGEQPGDEIPENLKSVSFTHKKVSQRIAVVLAGPLMNLFFAVVVLLAVAILGEDAKGPQVGDVEKSSVAETAGFRSGDTLLSVNGVAIKSWDQFQTQINERILNPNSETAQIRVRREDSSEESDLQVAVGKRPNPNPLSSEKFVGDIEGLKPVSVASIVGVASDSPLRALALKTGDRIVEINGMKVQYFRQLDPTLKKVNPGEILSLTFERLKEGSNQSFETQTLSWSPSNPPRQYTLESLKLEPTDMYLGKIFKNTPAEGAGLLEGDKILSINGKKITSWEQILSGIKSYSGEGSVALEIARDSEIKKVEVTPQMTTQLGPNEIEEKRYTIGIAPLVAYANPDVVVLRAQSLGDGLHRAFKRTNDMIMMTLMSFKKLATGEISSKNIGGVISIAQVAHDTFQSGIATFLQMMALISVNLFIFNLLPVPVLDGGHLVFYTIEAVRGAPLSLKKMEMAQQVGIVLLMSLMVFALFNDVTRLFGKY